MKPTIYDIKAAVELTSPKFFSHENMKCVGQTLKSFTVAESRGGNIYIYAPRYWNGRPEGYTFRQFIDGKLAFVPEKFNTFGEISRFLASH